MRLFGEVSGSITRRDRAEWLTPPFDMEQRSLKFPVGKMIVEIGAHDKTVTEIGAHGVTFAEIGAHGKAVATPTSP